MPQGHADEIAIGADFYKRIYNFISQRVSRAEDAEEITQDVFLRFSQNYRQLDAERTMAWVYKTARNAIIDFYRKSGRQPKMEELPDDLSSNKSTKSILSQMTHCLQPFISKLSTEEQRLITEVDLCEKTQRQYAIEHDLPYSTVKTKIQRSRKKLKKHLLGCCKIILDRKGIPAELDNETNCC